MNSITDDEFNSFLETLSPKDQEALLALQKRGEELRLEREKNTTQEQKNRMHKRAIERKNLVAKMKKKLDEMSRNSKNIK